MALDGMSGPRRRANNCFFRAPENSATDVRGRQTDPRQRNEIKSALPFRVDSCGFVDHLRVLSLYGSIAIRLTVDIGTRSILPVLSTITMTPPSTTTRRTVDMGRSILVPSFESIIRWAAGAGNS